MGKSLSKTIAELSVPVTETGCFLWVGATSTSGYGNIGRNGRTLRAHRVAWELEYGPIPQGLQVLHHCDTPACVNPARLFLGSASDNMLDMHRKGRHVADYAARSADFSRRFAGAKNPNSKLCDDDVARIVGGGISSKIAAFVFGVSEGRIFSIRRSHRG
jgi:hypothetical protein